MTTKPEDLRPTRLELQLSAGRSSAGERCGCAHAYELHDEDGGACRVELPPFDEEELPAWRCPCRKYLAASAGPWRWHEPTQSWALPA